MSNTATCGGARSEGEGRRVVQHRAQAARGRPGHQRLDITVLRVPRPCAGYLRGRGASLSSQGHADLGAAWGVDLACIMQCVRGCSAMPWVCSLMCILPPTHPALCSVLTAQPKEIGLPFTAYHAIDEVREVRDLASNMRWLLAWGVLCWCYPCSMSCASMKQSLHVHNSRPGDLWWHDGYVAAGPRMFNLWRNGKCMASHRTYLP